MDQDGSVMGWGVGNALILRSRMRKGKVSDGGKGTMEEWGGMGRIKRGWVCSDP